MVWPSSFQMMGFKNACAEDKIYEESGWEMKRSSPERRIDELSIPSEMKMRLKLMIRDLLFFLYRFR
jgi:hypothetical protein